MNVEPNAPPANQNFALDLARIVLRSLAPTAEIRSGILALEFSNPSQGGRIGTVQSKVGTKIASLFSVPGAHVAPIFHGHLNDGEAGPKAAAVRFLFSQLRL